MTPTFILALEDYLPVLISSLAFFWIAQMIGQMNRQCGHIAKLGLFFTVSGGLLKATEKAIWASTGEPMLWMRNSLFILTGLGFAYLAWALWSGRRGLQGAAQGSVWLPPILFSAVALSVITYAAMMLPGRTWFFISLGIAVISNVTLIGLLIALSVRIKDPIAALLFGAYIISVFALAGLSRSPSPTINIEWIKQAMNTLAAVILGAAAWRLSRNASLEATFNPALSK
jgi:hypothetical protein